MFRGTPPASLPWLRPCHLTSPDPGGGQVVDVRERSADRWTAKPQVRARHRFTAQSAMELSLNKGMEDVELTQEGYGDFVFDIIC